MVNQSIRDARVAAGVRQEDLARALGIGRRAYIYFEVHDVPLPRGLTPSDALEAIASLDTRTHAKAS